MSGTIYLIPVPLTDDALQTLSGEVAVYTAQISHYFAEHVRTARRFLRVLHPALPLENIQFSEIDKHKGPDIALLRAWLRQGHSVGIMSEAGCPGIADPGSELVAAAHTEGSKVIPLVGPNSLILALMASGLNGQSFCFNGYLPVKEPMRSKRIKELEAISAREKQTQLFIETPYRNDLMLADMLKNCRSSTQLCIAQNLTAPNASVHTKTIAEWNKTKPQLGKDPAVFLMLA